MCQLVVVVLRVEVKHLPLTVLLSPGAVGLLWQLQWYLPPAGVEASRAGPHCTGNWELLDPPPCLSLQPCCNTISDRLCSLWPREALVAVMLRWEAQWYLHCSCLL